jgi:hypothetical protein
MHICFPYFEQSRLIAGVHQSTSRIANSYLQSTRLVSAENVLTYVFAMHICFSYFEQSRLITGMHRLLIQESFRGFF